MNKKEVKKIISIAKMYHEENLTQEQISEKVGISRSQISKLLTKAKELGFITTIVLNPLKDLAEKEKALCNKYGLNTVKIAIRNENETSKEAVGREAGRYLSRVIKNNDTLGISLDSSLPYVANALIPRDLSGAKVIQFKGNLTYTDSDMHSFKSFKKFVECFKARLYYMPIPSILENQDAKEYLVREYNLERIMTLANNTNIALFEIKDAKENYEVLTTNCDNKYIDLVKEKMPVGEIVSRFFTSTGEIFNKELDSRATTLELNYFKEMEHSIGIAEGTNRVNAILAAINGKYINTLIVDEEIADILLNKID